jgi:hypothetical protein
VTSISPTSGPLSTSASQTLVTISGNGFVAGSTVNFIQETGPNPGPGVQPTTPNVPTSATSPTVNPGVVLPAQVVANSAHCTGPNNTNCTIQAYAPAVTTVMDYYITVNAPTGTSSFVPTVNGNDYDDFVYTAVTPTVNSPLGGVAAGSITGGTALLINGTGFFNTPNFPMQVWLVCSSGCTAGSKVQATNVSIQTPVLGTYSETVTAQSPSVTAAGTYYVQVIAFGLVGSNTSDTFTYSVQAPIITSISVANQSTPTGPAGTVLTITGANFLTGSTVGFQQDVNGSGSGAITNATVTNLTPTQITVTVPTLPGSNPTNYFPIVTLPSQYSSVPASQPYNEPADIFIYT